MTPRSMSHTGHLACETRRLICFRNAAMAAQVTALSLMLSGCDIGGGPTIIPADHGVVMSKEKIRSALGEIETAAKAADLAASNAAPKVLIDRSIENKSFLCLDSQYGPVKMSYGTKGQFTQFYSNGAQQPGFRFESLEGGRLLTGLQYGKDFPQLYKTSRSDGQLVELWTDAKSGAAMKRCFKSMGQEYIWFEAAAAPAVDWVTHSAWQCSGPLEVLGSFSVDAAGRTRTGNGGAVQLFIWSTSQTYFIDVFQSTQPWVAAQANAQPPQQEMAIPQGVKLSLNDNKPAPQPVDLGATTFNSVDEYTVNFSELAAGKWSYLSPSGAGGTCIMKR